MLVNLGWVAAPAGRERLPQVQIPAVIDVHGLLRTQLGGFRLGQNIEDKGRWPMRIQQVYVPALDPYMRSALYPGLVYQMESSSFLIHYQPVVISPERHRAYALQWGLLAFAVLVVALAASSRPLETAEAQPNTVGLSDDELLRSARDRKKESAHTE
jgi:cytochrome oxidase assembly protein ShyY1